MPDLFILLNDPAVNVLARTIKGEADNQPWIGKIAVGFVVKNRTNDPNHRWPNTIVRVCQQPLQFSCWNLTDPNRARLERLTGSEYGFAECLAAALMVLEGLVADPTRGANHYHTIAAPKGTAVWPPPWANGESVAIGAHKFYKL